MVRYRFDGYVLDISTLELTRSNAPVHLEPQVFDVLVYLVTHRDRVVTKEELLDEVWQSRFVSESALTSRIKAARRAIGDDGATQSSIRTIRGRGFRFIRPVEHITSPRVTDEVVDGHDEASPASASTGPRTWVLPTPTTLVIGRDADAATAHRTLERSRLVTILGPGGVGKTTLAMRVAADQVDRFTDGAFWCDWAPVADPGSAVDAFADAVGISRQADVSTRAAITAGIGTRRILVVADNCEHIVEHAAALLADLVTACPNLTVLATSRSPLGPAGEALVPLNPLPCRTGDANNGSECHHTQREWSTAASMFVQRAEDANPSQQLDDRRDLVEQLCHRLDGLPLALELAAARLRTSTIEEVAAHINSALDLANAPHHGRIRRHQTLRDTITWSYRLLNATEQELFQSLWVFAGSFTAPDVAALMSELRDDGTVTPTIDALVDHSMIVADRSGPVTHYRMLETLRSFASDTLTPDEQQRRHRAHAAWACTAAEDADTDIRGPDEAVAVRRFDQLFNNLRSAHTYAIATNDIDTALRLTAALHCYAVHRLRDEVVTWAEAACELSASSDHHLRPVAIGALAQGLANRGQLTRARALATDVVEQCEPSDRRTLWALRTLSNVALYEGRLADAVAHADREVDIATDVDDASHLSYATVSHVLAATYAGRIDDATELARVHAERARRANNPTQLAWSKFALGELLAVTNRPEALDALDEALAHGTAVDSHFVTGVTLVAIASTQVRLDHLDDAMLTYARTIDLWHRRGDWIHQWTTLRNVVALLQQAGREDEAARLLGAVTAPGRGAATFGQAATEIDHITRILTDDLGTGFYDQLVDEGRHLSPDETVELALVALENAPRPTTPRSP